MVFVEGVEFFCLSDNAYFWSEKILTYLKKRFGRAVDYDLRRRDRAGKMTSGHLSRSNEVKIMELRDCGNCKFFEPTHENWFGHCRRYPPVILAGTTHREGAWPEVLAESVCGEFSS
jgi:hypothetical protein